jgi:hypothetical protein
MRNYFHGVIMYRRKTTLIASGRIINLATATGILCLGLFVVPTGRHPAVIGAVAYVGGEVMEVAYMALRSLLFGASAGGRQKHISGKTPSRQQ